jgi:hypothetical protein
VCFKTQTTLAKEVRLFRVKVAEELQQIELKRLKHGYVLSEREFSLTWSNTCK